MYSFDRVPLALSAVSVAVAAEAIARFRRRERVRPALSRGGWYVAALAATLGAAVLLGLAVGANPLAYVPEQRRIATAYGASGRMGGRRAPGEHRRSWEWPPTVLSWHSATRRSGLLGRAGGC
ncbi:MAG: hypothetical protein IPM35_20290 [Myxococcales bacterium]|nr:hypothetical protein [Myxococcales bacterium]